MTSLLIYQPQLFDKRSWFCSGQRTFRTTRHRWLWMDVCSAAAVTLKHFAIGLEALQCIKSRPRKRLSRFGLVHSRTLFLNSKRCSHHAENPATDAMVQTLQNTSPEQRAGPGTSAGLRMPRLRSLAEHYTTSAISSNMKSKSATVHSLASNCTPHVCRHFTCGISQLFHSSVFSM